MTQFITSDKCKTCYECNKKSPFFNLLSDSELVLINSNRYEVTFKAGENIIKQGTSATHLISLTRGLAKLYIEGFNNRNLILELIKPLKIFGGPGIFIDNRYHYSVTAVEPTSACFIDSGNFKKLIRDNPDFMEKFLGSVSMDQTKIYERFVSLTQKQMHGRIADILLYLCNDIYHKDKFELTISRQDIADLSSMSKDSAIRILKEMEHEGIILASGKNIEIKNKHLLKDISLKG